MSVRSETRTTSNGDGSRQVHTTLTTTTSTVRHSASPHNVIITRTSGGLPSMSSSSTMMRSMKMVPADVPDFESGTYQLQTAAGVSEVKTARDNEKKELQDLNDRFANYLDKVRMLEAQNRKLADDLDKLKSKWGKETMQIKAMFQVELDEARNQLNDAEMEKGRLEIRAASLEDQIEEIRSKLSLTQQEITLYTELMNQQKQTLGDNEREIEMLRKQLDMLDTERDKDRSTITKLEELLARAREDLDSETLAHINAENRRQTLREQIEFLKSVHEQEVKELAALAYRDTSPENRDYWKNELQLAIREIQQMYDSKLDMLRSDLESTYTSKLQEMRSGAARQSMEVNKSKDDCKDLRNELTDIRDKINDLDSMNNQLMREIEALKREKEDRERELEMENEALRSEASSVRDELEMIMRALQQIMNTKLSLELEIAAYRKLLESEENRYDRMHGSSSGRGTDRPDGSFGTSGEMSAKTTYQRSAKGPVAISDSPPDGFSVTIENTSRREENLENWRVVRTADGKETANYKLDSRFKAIRAGSKLTIWARGHKASSASMNDIEFNEPSWGIGAECVTKLVNPQGEERSSLTQRTVYS